MTRAEKKKNQIRHTALTIFGFALIVMSYTPLKYVFSNFGLSSIEFEFVAVLLVSIVGIFLVIYSIALFLALLGIIIGQLLFPAPKRPPLMGNKDLLKLIRVQRNFFSRLKPAIIHIAKGFLSLLIATLISNTSQATVALGLFFLMSNFKQGLPLLKEGLKKF